VKDGIVQKIKFLLHELCMIFSDCLIERKYNQQLCGGKRKQMQKNQKNRKYTGGKRYKTNIDNKILKKGFLLLKFNVFD
jgi:hypothetical protein